MAAQVAARDLLARFAKLPSGQQNLAIIAGTVASIYLTKAITDVRRKPSCIDFCRNRNHFVFLSS
jgi:hypothetical protein